MTLKPLIAAIVAATSCAAALATEPITPIRPA